MAGDGVRVDKRVECGCHWQCVMEPHDCDRPCEWPDCLTEAERGELLDELEREGL